MYRSTNLIRSSIVRASRTPMRFYATDGANQGKPSIGETHAKNDGEDSIVPKIIQKIVPESLERALPDSIHNTGDSTTHAKAGGEDSVVPKAAQKAVPEAVERALPDELHNTGDGKMGEGKGM